LSIGAAPPSNVQNLIAAAELILIDEADQADFEGIQYGAILKHARRYCGMTATPYRLFDG
jgi:hypothetical protein